MIMEVGSCRILRGWDWRTRSRRERHVVDELAASPEMANACLRSLDNDQAVEALTILARACTHHPAAPGLVRASVS